MNELRKRIADAIYVEDGERSKLPPELHQPHWDGMGKPHSWICSVCWGQDWVTRWPCETATKHGREVAQAGGMDYSC